jgi:uncharacterized protein DUF6455
MTMSSPNLTSPGTVQMRRQSAALGEVEQHFWLNRSVARAMGVNLSDSMADGSLSETGYAELITKCRAAGCSEACAQWLAQQTGFNAEAPTHCANADALTRLKRRS